MIISVIKLSLVLNIL